MAASRLSALAAAAVAVFLAASLPSSQGTGLVSLFGWVGVGALVFGLVVGHRGAVSASAVAFVIRSALMAPFDIALFPPLWAYVFLVVLMIELAGASFVFRSRPADRAHLVARALAAGLLAAALVETLATLSAGADASGVLVRVAGIAAVVIASGFVAGAWRRSGLGG